MQLETWNQIANMRTTLLHLQFLHCELQQKTEEQQQKTERSHKDRLIQLHELQRQLTDLQTGNLRKILIVKLQEVLNIHSQWDQQLWPLLDPLLGYVQHVKETVIRDITRVYIGKGTMMDIRKCEEELLSIQNRVQGFLKDEGQSVMRYNLMIQEVIAIREMVTVYMGQLLELCRKVKGNYTSHLRAKIARREKQIESSITDIKNKLIQ